MFAVATGAPVVVAIMRREGGLHTFDHIATLRPNPNASDRKEEARRIMREAMTLIDEGVRKTPEQWFWYNSRWILQPPKKHKKKGHRPRRPPRRSRAWLLRPAPVLKRRRTGRGGCERGG